MRSHKLDLLFIDSNLNGQDGFEVLQNAVANSFHTVVVSAYTDKAITAFDYGVLDFMAKPFSLERMRQALDRMSSKSMNRPGSLKFLGVKTGGILRFIPVEEVLFVRELDLRNGTRVLHDKTLEKLQQLLPGSFERIHKSYLADSRYFAYIQIQSGGGIHFS